MNFCRRVGMLFLIITALCGCASSRTVDNTPIEAFDLNRYLGTWYEIARFNHSFERDVSACKAVYSLKKNGMIEVENMGIKNGRVTKAVGRAKLTEAPALFRVSFFGPFYSDYRVLYINDDYTCALIGSSSADYLWILSRSKEASMEDLSKVLNEATRRGYEVKELLWVKHE